ncbi:hypothetical protein [Mesorhizobium neociceri]|uniref:Uncharacterized protein n=1 Tax=Mesorhizobium neociceri TaxID=1307853 RepID=A0A838BF89_9HYPH|nr:hypothetical protein [Mesorhizobium neociceri]MBA1144727.1 hypothetical protein [Mesorhizobium neociceri]
MQSSVEIDLAGRLESANRYIAELEIAKASAATERHAIFAENFPTWRETPVRLGVLLTSPCHQVPGPNA